MASDSLAASTSLPSDNPLATSSATSLGRGLKSAHSTTTTITAIEFSDKAASSVCRCSVERRLTSHRCPLGVTSDLCPQCPSLAVCCLVRIGLESRWEARRWLQTCVHHRHHHSCPEQQLQSYLHEVLSNRHLNHGLCQIDFPIPSPKAGART